MELELHDNGFQYCETVLETVLTREETLETIVPDACPDIDTVLNTEAHVCLRQREADTGTVLLGGTVRCSILYQPENWQELRALETELDFRCTAEQEGITPDSGIFAVPRVTFAETRTINPRKVLVRVGVAIEVQVSRTRRCALACGVVDPDTWKIQQLLTQREGCFALEYAQRAFSVSDDLVLPGSKPDMDEVLRLRCEPFSGEARVVGGKLIFKGGASVGLLYRTPEGETEEAEFELPLSQVLDVPAAPEQAVFQLELLVTDWSLSRPSLDGRTLELDLELLAQAIVSETRQLTLLSDAYSTGYATQPRVERVYLSQLVRQEVLHQSERALVESVGQVRRICDTSLLIAENSAVREEGQLLLSAQCVVGVTYQEAEGRYDALSRTLTVTVRVPAGEGAECRFTALPERVDAVETGGGLELRAAVAFHLMLLERQPELVVTALTVEETGVGSAEGQPSIVLRQVGAGETLWQIAKTYSTTRQEIMDANGMEEETPQAGQLLLIPRKR
ncbi:MAG: DUF3794 domain-containing protein [Clostridiales bacterium]|nr:DUF3794 domain-containing protein [Clostridiales bacterium]